MSSRSRSTTPPSTNKRGTACLSCRRRKVKCDVHKPACGPCVRASIGDDCEYADSGPSRTKLLEETIAQLHSRVVELESQAAEPPYIEFDEDSVRNKHMSLEWEKQYGSRSFSATPSPALEQVFFQEPPYSCRQILVRNFLLHANQVGFFLDAVQFQESALLKAPSSDHRRPTPALLATVYLWGVLFSQSEEVLIHEPGLLSFALQLVPTSLSYQHPMKTLHAIQSSLLLATYFFHSGRLQEGQEQCRIATSVVFSHGLHIARPPRVGTGVESVESMFQSHIETVRLNAAFWATIRHNNLWSAALGYPSAFSYSDSTQQVSVPWPLDFEAAPAARSTPGSGFTLNDFLSSIPDWNVTIHALSTKASVLFERASHLFAQSSTFTAPHQSHVALPAFTTLDNLITQVQNALPSLHQVHQMEPFQQRCLVMCHAVAHSATIQLHRQFASVCMSSWSGSLRAANSIAQWAGMVHLSGMSYINPIMAVLWYNAAEIIADALSSSSAHSPYTTMQQDNSFEEPFDALGNLTTAMTTVHSHCPLMRSQLLKLQERLSLNTTTQHC